MAPIFTSTNENGLRGYWYDEFVNQFDSICQQHLREGRAKAFAFIVYDFHSPTQEILQNQGVILDLDRLSGKDITVFYLDGRQGREERYQNKLYRNFNSVTLELAKQHIKSIPFIVFFDFVDGDVTNFKSYSIRGNEKFLLHDLTSAINERLSSLKKPSKDNNQSFGRGLIKMVITETPKVFYKEFIGSLLKDIPLH